MFGLDGFLGKNSYLFKDGKTGSENQRFLGRFDPESWVAGWGLWFGKFE